MAAGKFITVHAVLFRHGIIIITVLNWQYCAGGGGRCIV